MFFALEPPDTAESPPEISPCSRPRIKSANGTKKRCSDTELGVHGEVQGSGRATSERRARRERRRPGVQRFSKRPTFSHDELSAQDEMHVSATPTSTIRFSAYTCRCIQHTFNSLVHHFRL